MSSALPVLFSRDAPRALERIPLDSKAQSELGTAYSERWLQELIQRCPEVLPIGEIEPGFGQLIPVAIEIPLDGHGRVDNLFVTASGGIALVETKLWRNPESRRQVVAQALDYAAALSRMDYDAFEAAALKGEFSPGRPAPGSLYEVVSEYADAVDEAHFIDSVATNLRRGRMLVIAAGDGIRTEAEALAELLQSHAGARFTFALVAIELFRAAEGDILAVPRTIAKTVFIERGVVKVEDGRISIEAAPSRPAKAAGSAAPRVSMTEELFLETLGQKLPNMPQALAQFIDRVESIPVRPDWLASLNFKWYGDSAIVNLGYVRKDGTVATDATFYTAKGSAAARRYLEALAALSGGKVFEKSDVVGPYVIAADGKSSIRVSQLLPDKSEDWAALMAQFVRELESEAAYQAA